MHLMLHAVNMLFFIVLLGFIGLLFYPEAQPLTERSVSIWLAYISRSNGIR